MQTLVVALLSGLAGLLVGAGLVLLRWGAGSKRREQETLERRVSTLEQELARLRGQQRDAREILASMSDGVLVVDGRGLVQQANAGAGRLLAAPQDELVGLPLTRSARSFPALPLIDRALAGGAVEDLIELPGGRLLGVQALPLGGDGPPDRVLFLLRDETVRVRTENMRRDFVANVSHELKTPLARLALFVSTLRHAVTEDPQQAEEFLDRLENEVSRLGALVGDLLTLSEVEQRTLRLSVGSAARGAGRSGGAPGEGDSEILDLSEVARAVAERLRPSFDEADLRLDLQLEPVLVSGDRVYLETLIRNLLDNALQYSASGGAVELTVRAQGEAALLTVKDYGRGIPRDAQDRIFERFFRVDPARSRESGGTGLGLSIVRHIVEQHGGRVTVESAVGVGSTFTVRLPRAWRGD